MIKDINVDRQKLEEIADNHGLGILEVERIYDSILGFQCVNNNTAIQSLNCLKRVLQRNLMKEKIDDFAFACALYDVYHQDAKEDVYVIKQRMLKKAN